MSVLQLQIDIDSDVHPELHAMLASVVRGAARAERLLQLAAAGLIWEHLRVQAKPMPAATREQPEPGPSATAVPEPARGAVAAIPSAAHDAPPDAVPVLWDAVDAAALAPAAVAVTGRDIAVPAARKSGTRPRLLRMKERGLFQNGQDN